MTIAEALTRIQSLGYGTDTAVSQRVALLAAVRRVTNMRRWDWRQATTTAPTVIGTSSITLPAGVTTIDSVRLAVGTEYDELEYIPVTRFRELEFDDRDRGIPLYWTLFGAQLRVWPVPDRVYTATIDYPLPITTFATDGSADATELPGPDGADELYVWFAVRDLAIRQRDPQQISVAQQQIKDLLTENIQSQNLRNRQNSSTMVGSGFYDDDYDPRATY